MSMYKEGQKVKIVTKIIGTHADRRQWWIDNDGKPTTAVVRKYNERTGELTVKTTGDQIITVPSETSLHTAHLVVDAKEIVKRARALKKKVT